MNRLLIAEEWGEFSRRVLPDVLTGAQRKSAREAFYAGAAAMLKAVAGDLMHGRAPTAADVQRIESLRFEMERFVKELERQKIQ